MSEYPFFVAEMGANHNHDLDLALAIADAAKSVGADALKLQTYTPECMVVREQKALATGPWAGISLWELYERAALPWSWHQRIFEHCHSIGLPCFSSPFSIEAVDLLERLGCPMYKIASFEILDLELIERCAKTGQPLVISTGMATMLEIGDAIEAARAGGCVGEQLTLLKCTSSYPAPASEANLRTMPDLGKFGCRVGLSDHTRGVGVAVAAALGGATMIERHFTLGVADKGPDVPFSSSPHQFRQMIEAVHDAIDAQGSGRLGPTASEMPMLELRRTLRALRGIREGEVFTRQNIGARRPAGGLPPRFISRFLGGFAPHAIQAGEALTEDTVPRETGSR
jgi:N-acetylneuraminate synthase